MPRKSTLSIASANDLLGGHVVYLSTTGHWTTDRSDAAVFEGKEGADIPADESEVIDVNLIAVEQSETGAKQPVDLREIIRDRGPTVRPDLGRQAGQPVHYGSTIDGSAYHV